MPAKKETSGETKKTTKSQTRYSYGDVVKSNQEVRDAINALAESLRGDSPAPAPADTAVSEADASYLTSREQFELYNRIISRHDAEFADKQFIGLLEQICTIREDFKRLCAGMEQNISAMRAGDVLASFKNYQVDLDNMLKDAGVRFGAFGTPDQKADPVFQRVVGVVPTEDAEKDGTVAKRLSAGYEYKGRPIFKEKVMVYRSKSQ